MTYELDATYENGVLKLDHPLPLQARQRVKVVVRDPTENLVPGSAARVWAVIQEIRAEQKARGYAGTVTEIDRSDDEAYEARMREIMKNTVHGQDDPAEAG